MSGLGISFGTGYFGCCRNHWILQHIGTSVEHQRVSGNLAVSTVVYEEYILYEMCFVLVQGLCNEGNCEK